MAAPRTKSPTRSATTLALVSFFILHSARGYYLGTAAGYPANYATLYSDQYGLAYQQIWNEPNVGVVQVHPPTFHGKFFQKNLFPLWARHVGLATGEIPVLAAPAGVSFVPLAHGAPYPLTAAYPLATAPAGANTVLAAYPPIFRPVAPAETATSTPGTTPPPKEMADTEDAASPTAEAPMDTEGDKTAALSAGPAGDSSDDDIEPSVDPGASNNSPSFLGAPQTTTPVSVTVPDPDGKSVVVYQFPNLLEGLVQRFQNYFSTYNHITTTSVANAVANANANAVSNAVSNASSTSESNSSSDSKSLSLSDSKSQSESDSSSNSLSASNALSGSVSGSKGEVQQDGGQDGNGGSEDLAKDSEGTMTGTEPPTTTLQPPTSTHRQPTYLPPYQSTQTGRYPQRLPPRQWHIEPPQKSLSYEVHLTTEGPFQGYSYNRPRVPFDPYREYYEQRQRSNQWRPIPSKSWNGPRYEFGPQQGRSYHHRPRFDSHYYPPRI